MLQNQNASRLPGPGTYAISNTLTSPRVGCGVSYGNSTVDRFGPVYFATDFDVPYADKAASALGPGSYNITDRSKEKKYAILSPEEKRRKPQFGLGFQSVYKAATHWTIPKGGFVPKKGTDEYKAQQKIRKRRLLAEVPGPADYEHAATSEAFMKRTVPDAIARGLLKRNGGDAESKMDLLNLQEDSTVTTEKKSRPRKKYLEGSGFRATADISASGGLRQSTDQRGGLRWPAILKRSCAVQA